ncbi:MAG: TolC family protein [Acidobacteriota bacterium]
MPAAIVALMISVGVVATAQTDSGPSFRRVTLNDVLRAATTNNPLVEAALARLRAARGSRRAAGAFPNPTVTYQVENSAYPGRDAPPGLDKETSTFAAFPLEFLYQRGPKVSRAEAEMRAAEAALERARWSVALDAGRAYYRLALAKLALETSLEVRKGLQELEEYNRARAAEGVASEGDALRARVEVDRAFLEESLERIELNRAQAELAPFLGRESGSAAGSVVEPAFSPEALESELIPRREQILEEARNRHPEVREARARLDAARFETAYQQTLRLRQVGFTFGNKRIAGSNSMIAGISLPLPLMDRNRGEIERASAERDARELELAWAERTVVARLAAAWDSVQSLSGPPDGHLLERADETRKIALAAYREGAVSLLQVLDATRGVGETRRVYYRTLTARAESLLELKTVTAGGIAALLDAADATQPSKKEKR